MGGQRTVGIEALGELHTADAGELSLVLPDVDDGRLGDVLGHRHGLEGAVALVVDALLEVGNGYADERRELGQHLVAVLAELLPADDDGIRDLVVHDHATLAVEDAPARRLRVDRAHPVDVGLDAIAGRGQDLQVPQPGQEGGEEGDDDDANHSQPQPRRLQRHRLDVRPVGTGR